MKIWHLLLSMQLSRYGASDRKIIFSLDSLLYIKREREREIWLSNRVLYLWQKNKKRSPQLRGILISLNFMYVVYCYPSEFKSWLKIPFWGILRRSHFGGLTFVRTLKKAEEESQNRANPYFSRSTNRSKVLSSPWSCPRLSFDSFDPQIQKETSHSLGVLILPHRAGPPKNCPGGAKRVIKKPYPLPKISDILYGLK